MYKRMTLMALGLLMVGSLYAMEQPSSTFDVKLVNTTNKDVQVKFTTKYQRSAIRLKGFLDPILVLSPAAGFSKAQISPAEDVKVNFLKGGGYEYDITLKSTPRVFGTTQKAFVIQDIQPGDALYAIGSITGYKYTVPLDKAKDLVNQKKGQQKGPGKDLVVILITPSTIAGYDFKLNYKKVTPEMGREVKEKGWVAIEEEKARAD
jgi:hypothetical protein